MGVVPIRGVRGCGSTPFSDSSCGIAPRSTGSSNITAWTGCAGTGCTSASRHGGENDMAKTPRVTTRGRQPLQLEGGGDAPPPHLVGGDPAAAHTPGEMLLPPPPARSAPGVFVSLLKQ